MQLCDKGCKQLCTPFKHNLPRASALIVLNDVERGLPLTVMDRALISAMRTGVGAKYLARKGGP